MNLGSAIQRNKSFYREIDPMPTVVQELEKVQKELKEKNKKLRTYNSLSRKRK